MQKHPVPRLFEYLTGTVRCGDHAAAAQVESAVHGALTTANDDYANLLGLNQQAVAWELPAGNATHVTEQEGSFDRRENPAAGS
jgi:hypothetical protein